MQSALDTPYTSRSQSVGVNFHLARQAASTIGGGRGKLEFPIPQSVLAGAAVLARDRDVPLLGIMVASLAVVLHRYTGDERITVVVPLLGGAVGITIDFEPDATPAYVLNQASVQLARAQPKASQVDHGANYWLAIDAGEACGERAALALHVTAQPGGAPCRIAYDSAVFPEWFVGQLARHFLAVLDEFSHRPEQRVATLQYLSVKETHLLSADWTGTRRDYPQVPLSQLFEAQVARTPHATALWFPTSSVPNEARTLTYDALNQRANHVAELLRARGVQRDVPVGVHLERSPDVIVALLAILKSGGVYVPLDAAYPPAYVQGIVDETQPRVLLTATALRSRFANLATPILCIDEFPEPRERISDVVPASTLDDALVVMYTSGSTGRPKGVKHRQRQVANRLHWMWESYAFIPGDVLCQRSSVNVMPSMWELLGGLLHGVPTVLLPDAVVKDPQRLTQAIEDYHISFITLVPTLLDLVLSGCTAPSPELRSLRYVIIGGEPLTMDLYRRFRAHAPQATLINDYGATEVNTMLHYALPPTEREPEALPGARPVTNIEVYILDQQRQLVPAGVTGEVYVGGVALAVGYVNRAEETEKRFVPHPFRTEPEARLFRTGDLAFFLPDGSVHLVGRQGHQIKVHGISIDPSEVERVLRQHPEVRECALTRETTQNGRDRLHVHVVLRSEAKATSEVLREHLRARLPAHLVPSAISLVVELPKTATGKLNRIALAAVTKPADVPPRVTVDGYATLCAQLRGLAADVLGVDSAGFGDDDEFYRLGFDSVTAVDFVNAVREHRDVAVSVTDFYDHSSIARFARFVLTRLGRADAPADAARAPIPPVVFHDSPSDVSWDRTDYAECDVAIIGMSGRFPQAADLSEYWRNLCAGVDCVTEVPRARWDVTEHYDPDPQSPGKTMCKWGAFLDDIDKFEPLYFNISPNEARYIDPQQRLCLEECWKAIEDSGYAPKAFDGAAVGVFVGARMGDYAANFDTDPNAQTLLGNDPTLLVARISYLLNLKGPSLPVDTACSSSLTALHLACQSLRHGESKIALVGGVNVMTQPDIYLGTSKLGAFSPSGRCRAFDNGADGFVPGEGVAFVVLKPMREALRDGDNIRAVIRGTAINQDGRTNGIAAPSSASQSALQDDVYRRYGIDPSEISYVEAHGTGTKLGDPIEVEALTRSYRRYTQARQYCAIGSVKTNIGHLHAAAGIAGLIKVVLSLKHRQLPPSLHYTRANEHIDFSASPFYVNTELRPWAVPNGQRRRAAINSFGLGGANAHCVVEEPPERCVPAGATRPFYLVPVSARTEASLRQALERLRRGSMPLPAGATLRDLSYTLWLGRHAHALRHCFVARDCDDLVNQVEQVLSGTAARNASPVLSVGRWSSSFGRYLLDQLSMDGLTTSDYYEFACALADYWVGGGEVDAMAIFRGERAWRIAAPTYAFLRERHWVERAVTAARAPEPLTLAIANTPVEMAVHSARNETELEEFLRQSVGTLLGVETADIDREAALDDLGFDSIVAVNLRYEVNRRLVLDVPVEVIVQHRTVRAMAQAIAALRPPESATVSATDDARLRRLLDDDAALAALSGNELSALYVELERVVSQDAA